MMLDAAAFSIELRKKDNFDLEMIVSVLTIDGRLWQSLGEADRNRLMNDQVREFTYLLADHIASGVRVKDRTTGP